MGVRSDGEERSYDDMMRLCGTKRRGAVDKPRPERCLSQSIWKLPEGRGAKGVSTILPIEWRVRYKICCYTRMGKSEAKCTRRPKLSTYLVMYRDQRLGHIF